MMHMPIPLRSILGPAAIMIIAAACGGNTAPAEETADRPVPDRTPVVGDTVHLALGAERRIDDRLSIRFVSRVSDDRCPANVVCVRAGDARVRIGAQGQGASTEGTVLVGAEAAPLVADGYRLTVAELNPYPGLEVGHPGAAPWIVVKIGRP
jgi:hypothetical protein